MKNSSKEPEVAYLKQSVQEDLPLPMVFYPVFYGTFISFADRRKGVRFLCECARPALINLLLLSGKYDGDYIQPNCWELERHLSPYYTKKLQKTPKRPDEVFFFRPSLCHSCNHKIPSLIWCHPMYGNKFVQRFGWYIRQTSLEQGFFDMNYLPGVCPPEIAAKIDLVKKVRNIEDFWSDNRDLIEELYPFDFMEGEYEPVIAPTLPFSSNTENSLRFRYEKELEQLPEKLTKAKFKKWYPLSQAM